MGDLGDLKKPPASFDIIGVQWCATVKYFSLSQQYLRKVRKPLLSLYLRHF